MHPQVARCNDFVLVNLIECSSVRLNVANVEKKLEKKHFLFNLSTILRRQKNCTGFF